MIYINITVRAKKARAEERARVVCGNSDYTVRFDFDEEWAEYAVKTARFVTENGNYTDVQFEGSDCPVPILRNTRTLLVGVFAGNLRTTTAASIHAVPCITDPDGTPADPTPDVYAQLMERLNELEAPAAVLYTEQNLTDEQKAQARDNIGVNESLGMTGATVGQVPVVKTVDASGVPTEWEAVELPSGAYIVNLTMDNSGNITADKTFAEIKAASDDGKVVVAKFAGAIVPLCSLIDSEAVFARTRANSSEVFTASLICTSDNVWSMSQNGFAAYSLGLTGATVGQTVKIKAVDEKGAPTEWEAVDAASGGSGEEWVVIYNETFSEDLAIYPAITITGFADDYSEFEMEYVLNTVSNTGNAMSVCVNEIEHWITYTNAQTGDFSALFKIRKVGKYALIIGMNACGESTSSSNITGVNGGLGTGNVYLSDGKITSLGFKSYGFTAKAGSVVKVRAKR